MVVISNLVNKNILKATYPKFFYVAVVLDWF